MTPMHEKLINVNDGVISCRKFGLGPTVIFIAGGPAAYGSLYENQLQELADSHTILFWDYAGCGKSVTQRKLFSIQNDLDDLKCVINAENEPVILMGHSYGGLLAIKSAFENLKAIKALVLINSMSSFSHAKQSMHEKQKRLIELGLLEEYLNLGGKIFSEQANAYEMSRFWKIEAMLQVRDIDWSSKVSSELFTSFSAVLQMQQDLMNVDYSAELKSLKIPILITAGAFDLISLKRPHEMCSWLSNAEFHEYSKSGHMPFLEENKLFIEQTSSWLRKIN